MRLEATVIEGEGVTATGTDREETTVCMILIRNHGNISLV